MSRVLLASLGGGRLRLGQAALTLVLVSGHRLSVCNREGGQGFSNTLGFCCLHLNTHRGSLSHTQVGCTGAQRPGREKKVGEGKALCTKQPRGRGDSGRGQLRKGGRALRSRWWQEEKKDAGLNEAGKKTMKREKDESGKD